jgi:hypothetical protein
MTLFFLCFIPLFFIACPMEDQSDNNEKTKITNEDGVFTLEVTIRDGEKKYFSLSTGEEVTGDARFTPAWDIAFERPRLIYTNSGDSAQALASGGGGGIWHTDKIVLADVTLDDAVKDDPFYKDYNADTSRWITNMIGQVSRPLNVMTYLGYMNEDEKGIDGKSAEGVFSMYYKYDKKQFYSNEFDENGDMFMPPHFTPTMRVYIIRHGNGAEYSKVQISEYFGNYDADSSVTTYGGDNYKVTWQTFEE